MPHARSFDLRVPVPSDPVEAGWEIAATVFVPAGEVLAEHPPALVVMPGGGYGRRYFDLPVPGYSQARHHAERGTVVVAIDHLGTGDSSIPPLEITGLPSVAAASHTAVTTILDRLRHGTLSPGIPPVDPAAVIGAGQSLGGHSLAMMQAAHRTFDGVAMLGASMAGTSMPTRPGPPKVAIPRGTTPEQAVQQMLADTDWTWAFHWEKPAEPDSSRPPHDLASLVAADIAAGLPARRAAPPGSATYPGFGAVSALPGVVAAEAARIDVPVLLATGERDVCRSPAEEVAMLAAATDISVLVVPRMAHMHNFAATRAVLWERLDDFITRVARTTPSRQTTAVHGTPSQRAADEILA
jgi:pimeloyl-ACP methyl ester carboxylesterase